jgi:hypothetical protein
MMLQQEHNVNTTSVPIVSGLIFLPAAARGVVKMDLDRLASGPIGETLMTGSFPWDSVTNGI